MNYSDQARRFDWRAYDRYAELWQDGEGMPTPAIAARFGRSPCEVRRVLEQGARLERWRDG